jgi:hypothetical protein
LFWIFLHIFWLIGFRNRFVVMTEWAWAYSRCSTGAFDPGDPPGSRALTSQILPIHWAGRCDRRFRPVVVFSGISPARPRMTMVKWRA